MDPHALQDKAEQFYALWMLGRRKDADDAAHDISERLGCYGRRVPSADFYAIERALGWRL